MRRCLFDHRVTFLELLLNGIDELEVKDGDLKVDESVSSYEPASSDVVALDSSIPQTSWEGARKLSIEMLGEELSSFLKPLKRVVESGFEFLLKSGETPKCFPVISSYCYHILKQRICLQFSMALGT